MIAPRLGLGLHLGIPAATYHADALTAGPTLSSSIAKTLLTRTPRHAWAQHPRLGGAAPADADAKFDLGSVAHELILGRGAGFRLVGHDSYATKAAKAARDEARAEGAVPILAEQFGRARDMAAAVWAACADIPECAGLFDPDQGSAETVGLWQDAGGPVCRMMVDWLGPRPNEVWDLKTTSAGLSDAALSRLIENLGYDLSAAFYLRGLAHLMPHLAGRMRFRWIFVEAEPPHEVRVIEADAEQLGRGAQRAALAIAKWQRCMATGQWPGYPREIARVGAPGWAETAWLMVRDDDPDWREAVLLDQHPTAPQPDSIIFGERRIALPPEAA